MTMEVGQGKIRIHANSLVVVDAPKIELIENSNQHLVFGENLMAYLEQLVQIFQIHTHPGELALGVLPVTPAPPVPPFPPVIRPTLISNRTTTG